MTRRMPAAVPEGLLLFCVAFGPLAFGAVEWWSRGILEAALLLLFAATALRGDAKRRYPSDRTLLPAFLFLLLLGAFQLLNPRPVSGPAGALPFTADPAATGRTLLLWACYAALVWSAPRVLGTREAQSRFAWTVFGVGVAVAAVGIVQLGQGNTAYYGLRPIRQGLAFGPYVNRDHAGSLLVMAAMTGGGLFLSRWSGYGRGRLGASDLAGSQAVLLFLLGVVLCGAFLTRSRGAFNSFFVALWAALLLATGSIARRGRRWAARVAVGALAPGYLLFLALNPAYIGHVLKAPDLSTAYRLSMYRGGLRMLADFPVWGVGAGAVQAAFPAYQERVVAGVVDHVHGDWLEAALQTGLAGTAVLATGLGAFAARAIQSWRGERSPSRLALAGGAGAAGLAFLLHQTVDFGFQIPANATVFLALICFWSVAAPAGAMGER